MLSINPENTCIVTVAAIKPKATVITGTVGEITVEIMLDSGSSISLIQQCLVPRMNLKDLVAMELSHDHQTVLITACGQKLQVNRHIHAAVKLCETNFVHNSVVTEMLVAPVILGVDFFYDQGLVLDLTTSPVSVCQGLKPSVATTSVKYSYASEE